MSIHSGRRLASVGAKAYACGLFCCGVALGQVDPPEATAPSRPESTVKVTTRGTVEMHVSEMPLDKVLQLLSLQSRRNIIASPAVVGSVTASLFDVSFE